MANILIAEDDNSMRQFLTSALEKAGHVVIACDDGLSALGAVTASPDRYDLLLADIVMPGIDGIELASRAARIHPGLKVLFMTGFTAVERKTITGGGDPGPVLSKPFHLGQLVQQIETILSAK
jgi:two-component system cell cycle response regulator CpdR